MDLRGPLHIPFCRDAVSRHKLAWLVRANPSTQFIAATRTALHANRETVARKEFFQGVTPQFWPREVWSYAVVFSVPITTFNFATRGALTRDPADLAEFAQKFGAYPPASIAEVLPTNLLGLTVSSSRYRKNVRNKAGLASPVRGVRYQRAVGIEN